MPAASQLPGGNTLSRVGQVAVGFGVVLLIGLLAFGLLSRAPDGTIDQALADGELAEAPGFELDVLTPGQLPPELERRLRQPLADGRLALDELHGLPVVLNFWASWCAPCRQEAPILEAGWRKWSERGVLFLGLNMQDTTEDARAFLTEFEVGYPSIRDPGKEVSLDYGLTGIPETYFIDAKGRVVAHAIGALDRETLDQDTRAALTGQLVQTVGSGESRPPR